MEPESRSRSGDLARAIELHRRGDLETASRIYRDHIARDVDVAEASQYLGVVEFQRGEIDEAITLLRRSIELAPEDPSPRVNLGHVLSAGGELLAALEQFDRAVALAPHRPEAHRGRAAALRRLGRSEDAVSAARRAVDLEPRSADAWNALGVAHAQADDAVPARKAYARAIALDANHREAFYNLGLLRELDDEFDEALDCYRRVIELDPSSRRARLRLAASLRKAGHLDDAVTAYRELLGIAPDFVRAYEGLGVVLYKQGSLDAAAQVYRDWLERDPDNPTARHLLAATTGEEVPERAADDYVATYFDAFAATFDENLEHLRYAVPSAIRERLDSELGDRRDLVVLDAGCGTGLCAPFLRSRARELVGVDLSPGMLDKARELGLYDALEVDELTRYLNQQHGRFDLIACADTVCYFGNLDALFGAVAQSLARGGSFVFSTEVLDADDADFVLHAAGRYAHSPTMVRAALERAGLDLVSETSITARFEAGEPVRGCITSAIRR
ncbi:MAG: tetratricopeptide repeat protein [Planctomycetes bacterium]|nr:tetratricopeptide repeat protein [Planctomycetota bacterium]